MQRERHIKSGRLLEVDFYPVWENGHRMPVRAPKTKCTSEEQQKYNHKRAVKHFVRMVNTNFDTGDILLTVTYSSENAPDSLQDAEREMYNYIRRIKTRRTRELKRICSLLDKSPGDKELLGKKKKLSEAFRYIITAEETVYKTGKYKGKSSYHFHCFMTGGIDRDVMEDMWTLGARVNADRYQPDRFGPETAAKYCSKDPKGKKRFCCSRNLKKPVEPKPRDGKITARGVEKLAKERVDDREYWEKKYKGYRFVRCFSRYNEYNASWYVSVVMYKSNTVADLPPWGADKDEEILW